MQGTSSTAVAYCGSIPAAAALPVHTHTYPIQTHAHTHAQYQIDDRPDRMKASRMLTRMFASANVHRNMQTQCDAHRIRRVRQGAAPRNSSCRAHGARTTARC